MKYRGSCHCGQVAFEVDGELKSALTCNCSICQRKGSMLWFVPRSALNLLTPEDASTAYRPEGPRGGRRQRALPGRHRPCGHPDTGLRRPGGVS